MMIIDVFEIIIVDSYCVVCDGGDGVLGYLCVYFMILCEVGYVVCFYCGCKYVYCDFVDKLV